VSAALSNKRAQPSPVGRGWPRSGRERGIRADRLRAPLRPRSLPLTPVLRTDPLPLGEGGAARNLRRRARPSLTNKRAQPSPVGRGLPRSGRERGFRADRLRALLRPRLFPLTSDLRSDPLPLGEGGAAPSAASLSKKGTYPSPIGRAQPRSGRERGCRADRLRAPLCPRLFPLTPDLRSDPLPLGEGEAAQPSPIGRAQPRSGRERDCRADRLRASLRPRSLPLTPDLRSDPLPLGEGEAARNQNSLEARQGRSRRAGARNIRCAKDFLQHPVQSLLHFVIGEAQLQIAVTFDRGAAGGVGKRLIRMMPAVEFDRERKAEAAEIDDVAIDRNLAPKLQTAESTAAQLSPKRLFGGRAVAAQTTRDVDVFSVHRAPTKAQNGLFGYPSPGRSAATLSQSERVTSAR